MSLSIISTPSVNLPREPASVRRRKRAEMRGGMDHAHKGLPPSCLRLALGLCLFRYLPRLAVADTIVVAATQSTVTAGEELPVEWNYSIDDDDDVGGTTGDLNPFAIELRVCGVDGADCKDGGCGSSTYSNLCPQNGVCMDSDGSYDVVIPSDAGVGDYVIRVSYLGTFTSSAHVSKISACTASFALKAPDVPLGAAALEAMAPQFDVSPGQAFTAQWTYDNGEGKSDGNFDVDLYSCENGACLNGSCGTFSASLCGTKGCFDPGPGDYDVRIPSDASPGDFKLRVTKTDDDGISGCTNATFEIVEGSNQQFTPRVTPAPVLVPTPSPMVITSKPSASDSPVPNPTTPPTEAPHDATPGSTMETPAPTAAATDWLSSSEPGSPGIPPSPVPPRIECNPDAVLTYSYQLESSGLPLVTVEHASGDREDGCMSLTSLWEWLQTSPAGVPEGLLEPVEPASTGVETMSISQGTGLWILRTSVDVMNGVMMEVKGTDAGGDCDELFLSSSADNFFRLRGYGGHLNIYKTKIVGWNEETDSVHAFDADSDGSESRSYVSCVSEVLEDGQTCEGRAQKERGECRMDVIDSEMGYLGFKETESYGLTWKVRGLCKELENVETLFERVRVYGDIQDSVVHHLWYGHYSYGHLGGVWTNNILHDNHVYGFDPHDDSDYLTIEGNTCYNNGDHGIIASKRCDHLLIRDNISFNNGGSGIMLHRSCDDSTVTGNELRDNDDAGLSLVETSRTLVFDNEFVRNKWGVRILVGATHNKVWHNTFEANTAKDLHMYKGPDEPVVAPHTGINVGNIIDDNTLDVTATTTVDIEDSEETSITNNYFGGTTGKFSFLRSNETRIVDNVGVAAEANAYVVGSCFTPDSGMLPVCE